MRHTRIFNRVPALLITFVLGGTAAYAASAASKNKEGNRLFQQGKYQEAEKAYLGAQLDAPGKPELLYNLGNTLIKQKKYDSAVQSLRQAAGKADQGLQASSWYNLGNAFFESGKMSDAAQSYIQALRINPSDRDAKHNLELALRRMKEQKQNSKGQGSKNDQSKQDEGKQDKPEDKNAKQDSQGPQQQHAGEKDQQEQPQPVQADRRDGSFSKDRALQILDAMKNQELADQRKLQEHLARRKATGRDW
jgi:tetratricopeptide (TPR) repeat protein